jgi:hypothetical protein
MRIAPRFAINNAQIGDAAAIADQMNPLVPGVDTAIGGFVYADLHHWIEDLPRRDERLVAVDYSNQREYDIGRRATFRHTARSAEISAPRTSAPRAAASSRQKKRSLINRRARLIRPTTGSIGASASNM